MDLHVVLAKVKRWLGLEEISDYERHALEEEHRRLEAKIQRIDGELGHVHCKSCPKELNPKAKRLLAKKRSHEKRQAEIEERLGGAPATKQRSSRRASKRADG